jgi:xylose dehydrogenase (NAD/NADP)
VAPAPPTRRRSSRSPRATARAGRCPRARGRAHDSYEALLDDPDVDAIYNPLPNSLHVPWTIKALNAGKHVLCEKPLTRRVTEAEQAFAAAKDSGRVLAEAFMWRHHPQARRLVELVAEGTIGRLRLVRATFTFPLHEATNIRLDPELDGGSLMDVGSYCLSGTRLLAGEPERVFGEQVLGGGGVDVAFSATLRFPADVIGQFDCGFAVSNRDELEAVGEEGSLFLDDPWHGNEPVIEVRRGREVDRVETEKGNPYGLELADFARAVRGEAPPLLGAEDAVAQARAIEALYESANTGVPITL